MTFTKMFTTCCVLFIHLPTVAAPPSVDAIDHVFTPDEVAAALGSRADELRARGVLDPLGDPGDGEDEDADVHQSSTEDAYRSMLIQIRRGDGAAPIWGPFAAAFRACAPGCVPTNFNIYRRGRHTCHSQGRAIDVGAIVCGGSEHPALAGGRFAAVVSCLSQTPGLYVLYRERRGRGKTRDHYDHAHVSIGCTL